MLVAVDRRPWRVAEVKDVPADMWTDKTREAWLSWGRPDGWRSAPYVAILAPHPSGKPMHVEIRPLEHKSWWHALPEHYAVCAVCGELAPCKEITAEAAAKIVMQKFDRLANVLPGCCWSCSEPVTSRQASRVFLGPNVWMPIAGSDPAFHLRRRCVGAAACYEDDWVKAEPSRERSLLTLRCTGSLIWHGDGTAECFGANDSECPGWRAWHGQQMSCYVQTHGCPRKCDRTTHQGCGPGRRRRQATP